MPRLVRAGSHPGARRSAGRARPTRGRRPAGRRRRRRRSPGRGGSPGRARQREAEQHDDEHGHLQQRRRVAGQALGEAHDPVRRAARADDDHEAEHEQRVGEDRADDRRLRDDELALLQREDHDEQLRQVAERRLQHPGDAGPEALAELLGRERHDPRQPGERERGEREARDRRPGLVVGHARERRQHRDQEQGRALERGQSGHAGEHQCRADPRAPLGGQ